MLLGGGVHGALAHVQTGKAPLPKKTNRLLNLIFAISTILAQGNA